mmetsp:Transcript_154943/g.281777  ORF Transcript_154943/g.281777 Transcript_154943/m.281777 type:complete len:174 (+) Transcript_154943:1144-1665(+)
MQMWCSANTLMRGWAALQQDGSLPSQRPMMESLSECVGMAADTPMSKGQAWMTHTCPAEEVAAHAFERHNEGTVYKLFQAQILLISTAILPQWAESERMWACPAIAIDKHYCNAFHFQALHRFVQFLLNWPMYSSFLDCSEACGFSDCSCHSGSLIWIHAVSIVLFFFGACHR